MSLLSTLGAALSTMQQALDAAGPAASATGQTAANAVSAIQAASTAALAYQASILNSGTADQIVQAQQLVNNLTVIQKNFSTGQAPKSVTVTGGAVFKSLYEIAAQFYNDPSLAFQLMTANNLLSPFLAAGVQTNIILPPLQSTS